MVFITGILVVTYRVTQNGCGDGYEGFLRVKVNGLVVSEQDACKLPLYTYTNFAGGFTATTNPTLLEFAFSNPGFQSSPQIVIDNVVVGPSNARLYANR